MARTQPSPEALESSCATRLDHQTPKTPAVVACMIAPMTEGADDLDLVRRMASGDRTAMRVLYGRHQLKVYRFIVSILRDPALAEDVLNDVFLDVWTQAGRFEGRSSVSTWLCSIA